MTDIQIKALEDEIRKAIIEEIRLIIYNKQQTFAQLLEMLFAAVQNGTAEGVRNAMKGGAKCTEI